MTREKIKESIFGSFENVQIINACSHDFIDRPAIIFGYMEVDQQCAKCKTWKVIKN